MKGHAALVSQASDLFILQQCCHNGTDGLILVSCV